MFENPRWRTTAILKAVKALNLSNGSTDGNEIWHPHALCPSEDHCAGAYTIPTILHNKTATIIKQNWLRFLFVVKSTALKQQILKLFSKF